MASSTEVAEFCRIPHCDEGCYLGVVEYTCPKCGCRETCYDLDVYHGRRDTFDCANCEEPLQLAQSPGRGGQ